MSEQSKFDMNPHQQSMTKQVMIGTLATAAVITGEKLILKIAKQPLLVFGVGMASGFWIYKNRQAIIDGATKTVTTGKQVALEQKEKLLDLVAEAREGS